MTQGATLYEPEEGSVERNMLGYEDTKHDAHVQM
jgi:hypothetical protein